MKKIIVLFVSLILLFSVGCSKESAGSSLPATENDTTPSSASQTGASSESPVSSTTADPSSSFDKAQYTENYLTSVTAKHEKRIPSTLVFYIYLVDYNYPALCEQPMNDAPDFSQLTNAGTFEELKTYRDINDKTKGMAWTRIIRFVANDTSKANMSALIKEFMSLSCVREIDVAFSLSSQYFEQSVPSAPLHQESEARAKWTEKLLIDAEEEYESWCPNDYSFSIYLDSYDYPVFFDEPMDDIPDFPKSIATSNIEEKTIYKGGDKWTRIITLVPISCSRSGLIKDFKALMALDFVQKVEVNFYETLN